MRINKIKSFIKDRLDKNGLIYKIWLRYVYKVRPHSTVVIELTDRCNLACSYCPKSKGIGLGSKIVDHDTFVKIYDNLIKGVNPKLVSLVGFGEPLINKNLYKAVQYVNKKTPKTTISITTNGILYTKSLAKKMSDSGLNQMIVSLNLTTKEIYIKYNLDDYFDTVMKNLEEISEIKDQIDTHIIVQILDLNENKPYLEEIKRKIEDWGFEFSLKPFINWGGEFDAEEENDRFLNIERYPCANIEQYLWIHLNGNVQACCTVFPKEDSKLIIGNIFEETGGEIVKGKKYKELQKLNCTDCLVSVDECKNCNAWAETPNIYVKIGKRWY